MDNINSVAYWNMRFNKIENGGNWESNKGIEQTIYWANLILDNLPIEIKNEIKNENLSAADIGSGLGQMASKFKEVFTDSEVIGYDFSDVAIDRCKNEYDNIEFINGALDRNIDISILSNVLEHIDSPIDMLKEHLDKTNKYCIILCPYKENPEKLVPEHVVSIDESLFIDYNNSNKIFEKVIDVRNSGVWSGEVILVIYKKKQVIVEEIKENKSKNKRNRKKK